MAHQTAILEQFRTITRNQDDAKSTAYLEAACWNLELAIELFTESGDQPASSRDSSPISQDAFSTTASQASQMTPQGGVQRFNLFDCLSSPIRWSFALFWTILSFTRTK